jgi:hypothetical protein
MASSAMFRRVDLVRTDGVTSQKTAFFIVSSTSLFVWEILDDGQFEPKRMA